MVEHVVLLRWKEEARPEEVDAVLDALRGLKDGVPGVVTLSCGANFAAGAKGFTHGLVVRLTDRAALEGYYPHPEHQWVLRELVNPLRADVLALDYEF